jgi:hypothetical protein
MNSPENKKKILFFITKFKSQTIVTKKRFPFQTFPEILPTLKFKFYSPGKVIPENATFCEIVSWNALEAIRFLSGFPLPFLLHFRLDNTMSEKKEKGKGNW